MSPVTKRNPLLPVREQTCYCAGIRDIISLAGDKWSVLIITILNSEPRRFGEMRRGIEGISQRMLTRSLRRLERYGLVRRIVCAGERPNIYYALTDLGKTLIKPIETLAEWAYAHKPALEQAAIHYDKAQKRTKISSLY